MANIEPTPSGMPIGANNESRRDTELAEIREALRGLRFGTVSIIVQDGVIVQIDRTEKRRMFDSVRRRDSGSKLNS